MDFSKNVLFKRYCLPWGLLTLFANRNHTNKSLQDYQLVRWAMAPLKQVTLHKSHSLFSLAWWHVRARALIWETCDIAHDLQAMRMCQRATRVSCYLYLCAYVVSHSMGIRLQHLQLPHIHHLLRAQRLCNLVLSFTQCGDCWTGYRLATWSKRVLPLLHVVCPIIGNNHHNHDILESNNRSAFF